MLLLPKTPPSTYLKTKKIKDQKITSLSLFSLSLLLFTSQGRGYEVDSGDQRKVLLKEIPNAARARLARGFIKEIPFKIQHVQD